MWIKYNPNPVSSHVGDCVIRALSLALNCTWDHVYMELCAQGYVMKDMPSSNSVWGTYLLMRGFKREAITDSCPDCYMVKDFCHDHKSGLYILCTGSHVVAVVDGHYIDDWDSGDEVPLFYYRKE